MTDGAAAWLETAHQLHQLGRQEEALRYCLSILEKHPEHKDALRLQAEIFVSLGRLPDAAHVYQRIAISFASDGNFLQALATAKDLHAIHPDNSQALTEQLAEQYRQNEQSGTDPSVDAMQTIEFPSNYSVGPTIPSMDVVPDLTDTAEDLDDEEVMIRRLLQLQGYDADAELSESELDDTLGGGASEEAPQARPSLPPLFRQLEASCTAAIWSEMETVRVVENEKIIQQGDPGESFYIIVEGTVVITHVVEGEEEELGHLGPGQFFGEIALLTPLKRTADVTAVSRCKLLRLDRSALEGIVQKYPQVHQELKRFVYQRLIHNLLVTSLLFFPLSDIKRWELAQQFSVVEVPPNYAVLSAGELSDGLYLIAGGGVALHRVEPGATPEAFGQLGPGQFFGEFSLLSREPAPCSIVSSDATTFLKLHADEFTRVMEQYPRVFDLLKAVAAQRSREVGLLQPPLSSTS